MKRMKVLCLWTGGVMAAGCMPSNPYLANSAEMTRLEQRALEALKRGAGFDTLASVRAQAIESLQDEAPRRGLPWIRTGLTDEHPAVRFAACMALGTLKDEGSRQALERLLKDDNASVRAAAIFGLHRLGDASHTAELASLLRDHPEAAVRRNAALILGRLGEPGAVALLAGVVNSKDAGLHIQALEAMVLLGNPEATQQMVFVSQSGNGPEEVLALNALAKKRDARFKKLMQRKLAESPYRETRLAAARGLGELGSADGLREALAGLRFDKPKASIKDDSPENQRMRIRQMAAAALGAIGDPEALPALADRLEDNSDARVQVATARAILRIIRQWERQTSPFSGVARSAP